MVHDALRTPEDPLTSVLRTRTAHRDNIPEAFTFKLSEPEEIDEVLRFRSQVYNLDLGKNPDDGFDGGACHLIVLNHIRAVVAAYRIVWPQSRPFEFEEALPLDRLVARGRSPAMIGRLCISPDYRTVKHSAVILPGLLRLASRVAASAKITDYYMCALPRLVKFYQRASFRELGVTIEHPDWGDLSIMRMKIIS